MQTDFTLPTRKGESPRVTNGIPHIQLDQTASDDMLAELSHGHSPSMASWNSRAAPPFLEHHRNRGGPRNIPRLTVAPRKTFLQRRRYQPELIVEVVEVVELASQAFERLFQLVDPLVGV